MDSQAMSRRWKYSLVAAVAALMAGCGGGGAGSAPAAAPVTPPAAAPVTPPPVGQVPVIAAPVKYAVGGTVSGLEAGAALTLSFGSEKLTVVANGSFAFLNKVESATAYSVTASAPAGTTCRVTDATGVVVIADVNKITVACAPVLLAGMAAALQLPLAVRADGAGNLYVIDSEASAVLKYSAAGAVTVVSGGTGQPGYADGRGAAARFGFGRGDLAVDAQGNVLLIDGCNNLIRKIGSDGEVTTLAGGGASNCRRQPFPPLPGAVDGAGAEARFASPSKMIPDGAGGAFVLDAVTRGVVRRVSAAGVVTSQHWSNPILVTDELNFTALARGADGVLYVADSRKRIWKDEAGMLVLVAGNPSSGDSVDGTGARARFRAINDMVFAPGGDLYVADSTLIRKVTPAGVVTTVAGNLDLPSGTDGQGAAAGFGKIGSITLDAGGLVVIDGTEGSLRRVGFDGAVATLAATPTVRGNVDGVGRSARINALSMLAADADGNLYVVDPLLHVLRKTTAEGSVTTVGGRAGEPGFTDGALAQALFNTPGAVAAGRDGAVWVAEPVGLRRIYDGTVTTATRLLTAGTLAVDPDGNAIVTNELQQVVRVTPAGQVTVLVTREQVAALVGKPDVNFNPSGLVTDAAGTLYMADGATAALYKLAKSGELSVFAGTPLKDTGNVDGLPGTATLGFYGAGALAIDDKGNVYLAGQGAVHMIGPTGVVSTPRLDWGDKPINALAYAKGKLYGLTRYAILQTWLP